MKFLKLWDRYGTEYDWFFIADSSTYVNSPRLFEFSAHLSAGYQVALGSVTPSMFCSLESGGLLLSTVALRKLRKIMLECKWTMSTNGPDRPGDILAQCVAKNANLTCAEQWKVCLKIFYEVFTKILIENIFLGQKVQNGAF